MAVTCLFRFAFSNYEFDVSIHSSLILDFLHSVPLEDVGRGEPASQGRGGGHQSQRLRQSGKYRRKTLLRCVMESKPTSAPGICFPISPQSWACSLTETGLYYRQKDRQVCCYHCYCYFSPFPLLPLSALPLPPSSLSLFLSPSMNVSVCLSLSLWVCVCVYVCQSVSLSVSL